VVTAHLPLPRESDFSFFSLPPLPPLPPLPLLPLLPRLLLTLRPPKLDALTDLLPQQLFWLSLSSSHRLSP